MRTAQPIFLAVPPAEVLHAMGTGRWRLDWSDEIYRHDAHPARRHRWHLVDLGGDRALLVEADQSGSLCGPATLVDGTRSQELIGSRPLRDCIDQQT